MVRINLLIFWLIVSFLFVGCDVSESNSKTSDSQESNITEYINAGLVSDSLGYYGYGAYFGNFKLNDSGNSWFQYQYANEEDADNYEYQYNFYSSSVEFKYRYGTSTRDAIWWVSVDGQTLIVRELFYGLYRYEKWKIVSTTENCNITTVSSLIKNSAVPPELNDFEEEEEQQKWCRY